MSAQLIGDDVLAVGYTCECGIAHKYPGYVYAHWDVELTNNCVGCGRRHRIFKGVATLMHASESQAKRDERRKHTEALLAVS